MGNAQRTHLMGLGAPKNTPAPLDDNTHFRSVWDQIDKDNSFLASYLKINYRSLPSPPLIPDQSPQNKCAKDGCTDAPLNGNLDFAKQPDLIKYPDNLIMGIALTAENDGIGITSVSNSTNLSGISNEPLSDSAARYIPSRIDGRWADIFSEHANLNALYYDFKKNNLTDAGLSFWKSSLDSFQKLYGFNLETDFIDQLDGPSNIAIFTSTTAEPQLIVTAHIKDEQWMNDSLKKMIDSIKKIYIQGTDVSNALLQNQEQSVADLCAVRGTTDPNCKAGMSATKELKKSLLAKNQELLRRVEASPIVQETTPAGDVFSWSLPNMPYAISYGFHDRTLFFGTHPEAVKAALALTISDTSKNGSLADNSLFIDGKKHAQADGIAQSFFVSNGFINILSYFFGLFSASPTETPQTDENFSALSAVIRTVKYIQTSQSIQGQFTHDDAFLNIQELPEAEKQAAERTMRNW